MKKLIFILLFLPFVSFGQDNIIIQSARLDGLMYGNESGSTDTLVVADVDSVGQYMFSNVRNPINPLDGVNLRTLINSTSNGWDSIPFNTVTGDLDAYLGAANVYSTNLDDRYIKYSDTTTIVPGYEEFQDSITAVKSLITTGLMQNVFSITLPYASTVAGRIALATEYPDGWILTADGLNIIITHGTGRRLADATVFANTSGTIEQKLTGTSAYNGLYSTDVNTVKLNSLATIPFKIIIYVTLK